jgi:hypothetical protein
MKFQILKIAGLFLMVIAIASCEKTEELAVANLSSATSGSFASSVSTVKLSKATKDNEAVKFTFSKADFGFQAAVKYTLQMDVKGNNFAKAREITLDPSNLTKSFTGLELNDVALALGLKPDVASVLQVRSKSEVGPSVAPLYSTPVEINVTPFALVAFVYVPGDYQGWNPSTADSLMSVLGDGKYEGIINFASKSNSLEFKVTPKKEWTVAYGDNGSGKVSTSAGNNLKASALYPHRISLNLNENTIAMERFSYGVIGDATPGGWGDDTNMNYDNGKREWSVTLNLVGDKELKFRLNDDWGTNYGDTGSDGTLDKDGGNIKIGSSGTYKIVLSFVTNTYKITKL